jgi:hypothetical protein
MTGRTLAAILVTLPLAACTMPTYQVDQSTLGTLDATVWDALARDHSDGSTNGSDGGVIGDSGPVPTWCGEVKPLVTKYCTQCHGHPPLFGAPFSVTYYSDTQQIDNYAASMIPNTPIFEAMAYRVAAKKNMPQVGAPQPTDAERDVFRRWSEGNAPRGTGCLDPDMLDAGSQPDATNPDASTPLPWQDGGAPPDAGMGNRWVETYAHAPASHATPYAMPPQTATDYECFAFMVRTATPTAVEHAIEFVPFIDNLAHVHHALLFLYPHINPNTMMPQPPALDGPYGCLGLVPGADLIGGWFPGRGTDHLPLNVGLPIHDQDQIVLQMHYDGITTGGNDQTGFLIELSDAMGMIDAGLLWTGYVWNNDLTSATASRQQTCVLPADLTLFADIPHMHRRGTHIQFEVQPGGAGPFINVVDVPSWSFDNQPIYPVHDPNNSMIPWQLHQGDVVRTTCDWNIGTMSVPWGEGSQDEMCFTFMYHYPAINESPSMPNLRSCVTYGP